MTLNDRQLEAVNHKEGPCLVLAGAGSGKTRVLTERIIKLVNDGVDPHNILAITFTNKAAKEMKSRVEEQLGYLSEQSFIGTFHSFGLRILRENNHRDLSPPDIVQYFEACQRDFIIIQHLLTEI